MRLLENDPAFRRDALNGLSIRPRAIAARWFYDHADSELFEAITELPEYYVTRTELSLLSGAVREIVEMTSPGAAITEFGSGSSTKTRILLSAIRPAAYVPVDISRKCVWETAARLAGEFRVGDERAMALSGWSLTTRSGSSSMDENEIREALSRHWAAADANDFEHEHDIYREDAVLEYPQSGERIRGRHNIQASRVAQPNSKRFRVRRIVGTGDLWVTEFILTYDDQPSYSVSIMEFLNGKVARETQYFGDPFEPGPSRAQLVERMG